MALIVFRRSCLRLPDFISRFQSASHCLSSRTSGIPSNETDQKAKPLVEYAVSSRNHNEHLISFDGECWPRLSGCSIETVDDDAWNVSSSLSQTWREYQSDTEKNSSSTLQGGKTLDNDDDPDPDPDHDEIDNMRIRGDLFYKIDRGSKEFEEYNYDFHRKNHHKTKKEQNHEEPMKKKNKETTKSKECNKRDEPNHETVSSFRNEMDNQSEATKKRDRTPTFNQLTAPYHYPFCLDIFISKASVRACVIHRVTSKVVSVAHSISKDMKFDLGSTRNAAACTAVGAILAQRTLEDDIHDIIYTPRRGDKLEGKLQIVLQAIIDNGVNVKVKLKQRKLKKKTCYLTTEDSS